MSVRRSHPRIYLRLARLAHIDDAIRSRVFIRDGNVFIGLDDLKRERHVGRARHARHITFHFRIQLPAICKVFLLFGRRFGLIRNLTALHDALAAGHRSDGAKLEEWPGLRDVIPDIPVRRPQCLPQAR